MEGAISDPYHLATYTTHSGGPTTSAALSITFTPVFGTDSGWVTTTVQGDGIHILDLTSLQPIASHTLGPSTFFTAPAITTIIATTGPDDKVSQRRRTYAAIAPNESASQSQIQSQEIWYWEDDISQAFTSPVPKKHAIQIPHDIRDLLPSPTGDIVLAISVEGQMSSLSAKNDAVASLPEPQSPAPREQVLRTWICARSECTFLPSPLEQAATVVIRLSSSDQGVLSLLFDFMDAEGIIARGVRIQAPAMSATFKDASFHAKGYFGLLASDGELEYHQLSSAYRQSSPTSPPELTITIRPRGDLVSIGSSHNLSPSGVSFLPLTPSHALFASTVAVSKGLAATSSSAGSGKLSLELQLWDIKYGVPLASFTAGLPSTTPTSSEVSEARDHPELHLTAAGLGHAILTILPPSPRPTADRAVKGTLNKHKVSSGNQKRTNCNILVIPCRVSRSSTLAAALLSRKSNVATLVPATVALNRDEAGVESQRANLLDSMRVSLKNGGASGPKAAVDAFWNWVDGESVTISSINTDPHASISTNRAIHPDRSRVKLPRAFVIGIVSILESVPPNIDTWATLRAIMVYLLVQRHVITNNMVNPCSGGVLRFLIDRSDWALVKQCVQIVPDLPEDEILRSLRIVADARPRKGSVQAPRAGSPTSNNVMEIDTVSDAPYVSAVTATSKFPWSTIPHLAEFLPAVISYPLSQSHLRIAVRNHFSDVDALFPIILMVIKWLRDGSDFDWMKARPSVRVDRYGKVISGGARTEAAKANEKAEDNENDENEKEKLNVFSVLRTEAGAAPVESTLSFLEVVLDASFLGLIQHPQGKRLITSIEEVIKPELDITNQLGQISAFLEPFSRAQHHNSQTTESAATQSSKDQTNEQKDSVARRNARDNSAAVKIYQVEELVL